MKNSELTYKEIYGQPDSFQAVNDTLEDIYKVLDQVFAETWDELIFTGCGTSLYLAQAAAHAFGTCNKIPAIYLKERFAEAVPENLPEILDFLAGERANIRQAVSCGGRREALMKELFWACMEQGGPLTREEVRRRMEKYREDEA